MLQSNCVAIFTQKVFKENWVLGEGTKRVRKPQNYTGGKISLHKPFTFLVLPM